MSRVLVVCLLLVVAPLRVHAEDLDNEVRNLLAAKHVPSASLAVVSRGKIVFLKSYGYASLEFKVPATRQTRYEIASMSKMFVATAIRMLADQGKLDLEDPVSKYFPGAPEAWKGMRVRHLVAMSSGLPEDWDFFGYHDNLKEYTDAEMAAEIFTRRLLAPVGQEFHYSGAGYALLGQIVEQVSGQPLARFMKERIFVPAGMTSTSYNDPSAVVPDRADGYRWTDDGFVRGFYVAPYLHRRADTGLLCTAEDEAKWILALDAGRIVKDPKRLWTEFDSEGGHALGYGYGWFVAVRQGHVNIFHSGGFRTGFTSLVSRFPDEDLTTIVLTNSNRADIAGLTRLLVRQYGKALVDPWEAGRDDDPKQTAALITALRELQQGRVPASVSPDAVIGNEDKFHDDAAMATLKFQRRIQVVQGVTPYRGSVIRQVVYLRVETSDSGPHLVGCDLAADGRIVAFEIL